jgi:phosphonate transport system ATP-binding protein
MQMSSSNDIILEIKDLNKIYPSNVHALKNVKLSIKRGEFVILLGLSGSGKSTLLRCINRLIEPSSGSILFYDEDITQLNLKDLRKTRRSIGMIFQEFNLIPNFSAKMNVMTGRLGYLSTRKSISMIANKEINEKADNNLDKVGLLDKKKQKAKTLSGGQKQRVAIARALMQEPEILLADEPVASLDPATADSVMRYLGKLNKEENITIICSLHFLSLARKYGSRVVALKDGELVFDGLPVEITNEKFKQIYGENAEEIDIK